MQKALLPIDTRKDQKMRKFTKDTETHIYRIKVEMINKPVKMPRLTDSEENTKPETARRPHAFPRGGRSHQSLVVRTVRTRARPAEGAHRSTACRARN